MKHAAFRVILSLFLASVSFAPAPASAQDQQVAPGGMCIAVDEVKPGMQGYGLTVMKGSEPERFEVEVIGVLRSIAPQRNGILVKAKGLGIEESGIVSGMSGSPVYVDGRLVGAIAFGWTWPKQPIGGVTPIGEMESALCRPAVPLKSAPSWDGLALDETGARARLVCPALPAASPAAAAPPQGLAYLAVPIAMPALSAQAREAARKVLPEGRFLFAEGVAASPEPGAAAEDLTLKPGSSVYAALVTGDMTVGAVGTVTDVRGNEVYAFGHPFLNQDDVSIPMYTSRVHTIFPSSFQSFKLASPAREVGAFVRDRATGIMGILGEKAPMVPMTVSVKRGGETAGYRYNVLQHDTMTPEMTAAVAAASVTALGDLSPDSTISYGLDVRYAGGRRLYVRWKTSGAAALATMAGYIAGDLGLTMSNPLACLDPETIDLAVRVDNANLAAQIESVTVRESAVYPGEKIHALVTIKPVLADAVTIPVALDVPADAGAGSRTLVVCDGRTSGAMDLQEARHLLSPRNVDDLLEVLTPKEGPSDLVIRMAAADRGLALSGRELPNLPASTLSILASPQQSALSPIAASRKSTAATEYVLAGKKTVSVRIKDPSEDR